MARRRNQGGPSLLIPMIIAGFAWIGMIGLAYYLHSEIYGVEEGKKTGIIFALQEEQKKLREYQVAVDSSNLETMKLTKQIGFGGESETPDSEVLRFLSQIKKNENFDIYQANYTQPMEWGTDNQATYPFKVEKDFKTGNLTYTTYFPYTEFAEDSELNLKDLILAQDDFINKVLVANNSLYNAILGLIQDYNKAYRSEFQATMEEHKTSLEAIRNKDAELDAQAEEDDTATESRDNQLDELVRTYNELIQIRANIAEIKKEIEKGMQEQDVLERKVAEARERLEKITQRAKGVITQRDEYDGTIFYVSKSDRWAYINLGAKDHILDNMTFNIIRYFRDGTHQRIGILKVRRVLTGKTSQCLITNIVSEKLFPRKGDKILSRTYTATNKIKSFGFLGYFGGQYSNYTREQMKGFLEKSGYRVDDEIADDTEVIILGFDYENDPYYKFIFKKPPQVSPGEYVDGRHELYKARTTYEYMRPEEVEHLLGMNK